MTDADQVERELAQQPGETTEQWLARIEDRRSAQRGARQDLRTAIAQGLREMIAGQERLGRSGAIEDARFEGGIEEGLRRALQSVTGTRS